MSRNDLGPLLDLDSLYAALDDDDALGTLVTSIAKACGTRSAMLYYNNAAANFDFAQMSYWPLDHYQAYFEHFRPDDPWLLEANALGLNVTSAFCFDAILPPERFVETEMFNELFRPLGDDTGRVLGAVASGRPDALTIGVHRAITDAAFSPVDAARFEDVRNHVWRILRARALIGQERREKQWLGAMLDASGRAIFQVDKQMKILHASAEALRCLDLQDRVCCRQRTLSIGDGRLDQEIRAAVRATIHRHPVDRCAFLCRCAASGAAFRLVVLPAGVEGEQGALIIIDEGTRPGETRSRWLRDAYHLTSAEAALAEGLLDGETVADIAARRRVSRETIRTQLKALFSKTETHRQTDLVRLLARMPHPPVEG